MNRARDSKWARVSLGALSGSGARGPACPCALANPSAVSFSLPRTNPGYVPLGQGGAEAAAREAHGDDQAVAQMLER